MAGFANKEGEPVKKLSGPFGYEMGQAISGEPDGQEDDGVLYQFSAEEFAGWAWAAALYTPQTGVCAIQAFKEVSDGDANGYAHRKAADSLVEALTKKYGAFDNIDRLSNGSTWYEPSQWLAAIRSGQLRYFYRKDGAIEGNLKSILVIVGPDGIMLNYTFNNYDAGEEAASEADLSNL